MNNVIITNDIISTLITISVTSFRKTDTDNKKWLISTDKDHRFNYQYITRNTDDIIINKVSDRLVVSNLQVLTNPKVYEYQYLLTNPVHPENKKFDIFTVAMVTVTYITKIGK